MKYTPPIMIDLSTGHHAAHGQGPLACIGGSAAISEGESCAPGTGANRDCSFGNAAFHSTPTCADGGAPNGDCAIGAAAEFSSCLSGTSGLADPDGCRTGPTPAS